MRRCRRRPGRRAQGRGWSRWTQRAGWAAVWSPIGDLVEAVHKRWSPRQPQDIEVLVDANPSTVSVPGFRALVKSSGANLGGERAGWRGFGPGVGLPVALSTGRKGRITSTSLRRWRVDGAKAELGPAALRCALRKASAKRVTSFSMVGGGSRECVRCTWFVAQNLELWENPYL